MKNQQKSLGRRDVLEAEDHDEGQEDGAEAEQHQRVLELLLGRHGLEVAREELLGLVGGREGPAVVGCVDGVGAARRWRATFDGVSGCLRRTFGVGRRRALLVRVLLKNLAPHIRAE